VNEIYLIFEILCYDYWYMVH